MRPQSSTPATGPSSPRRSSATARPSARSATTDSTTRSASPACSPRCSPASGSRRSSCVRSAGTATPPTQRRFIRGCATTRSRSIRVAARDAVAILQEHDALKLYDTRAQAIGGIVEEWDQWRRGYDPAESALIVHGPNSDVDLVNELAQRKRLDAGELGEQAIPRGRPRLPAHARRRCRRPQRRLHLPSPARPTAAQADRERPDRDRRGRRPERDTLTLLLREPGAEPRLVEIDQARLRAEHAAGKRAAAIRLNYALHSFPAQGATVHGSATLAGHWSQAKQETYVGDTRAIYRHTVHLAREDLGTDGTDEDRIGRYAQRISHSRQRHASIRRALDPTLRLAVDLPDHQAMPWAADPCEASKPGDASPRSSTRTTRHLPPDTLVPAAASDLSPAIHAGDDPRVQRHPQVDGQLERLLVDPPEQLIRALGPVPQERVARERWGREARRLAALGRQADAPHAPTPHSTRRPALAPRAPNSPPTTPPPRSSSPTINR